MLKITDEQLNSFVDDRLTAFAKRVSPWLAKVMPAWRGVPDDTQIKILVGVLQQADEAGMESEEDFALFSWLVLSRGPDWKKLLNQKDVRSILDAEDQPPEGKLSQLHIFVGAPEIAA